MISIAEEALPRASRRLDVRTWFLTWVKMPQSCFGGQAPERLLGTPDGRKQIRRLLGALVNGAYL